MHPTVVSEHTALTICRAIAEDRARSTGRGRVFDFAYMVALTCREHLSRAARETYMRALVHRLRDRFTHRSSGISRLDLSFRESKDEREYREFVLNQAVAHIRIAYVFALVVTVTYTIFDPFLYTNETTLLRAYFVRYMFLAPPVAAIILLTYTKWYQRNEQLVGSIVVVMFGIGCFLLAYRTNMYATIDNYASVIMTSIYAFFFSGLLFRYSFPCSIAICTLYILAITSVDLPPVLATSLKASLSVVFILLALAAYQKEFVSRQLYVTETREREALARQAQSDSRHIQWLRILAKFLRHEVRQPVAQINSGIELVKILGEHDRRVSDVLDNAILSTQHLWNLIERACRATDIEAYVRQSRLAMVDLKALLSDVITAYQRGSSGLDFRFHCQTQIWLPADAVLIEEAVRNLLNNAASYAYEGTAVTLSLAIDGRDALITVRNSGPIAPEDTGALFSPFSSTRSTPSGEHHGLGLYLVHLVAQQHGGRAELCNLSDGSGVEASIRLPLPALDPTHQSNDNRGLVPT